MKLMLYLVVFCSYIGCKAQDKVTGHYLGYQFNSTQNISYLSQELKFIKMNKDTLRLNLRLPYDTISHNVINYGIFYNCHLKEGKEYTIKLKKICVSDIPEAYNSYYKTNAIPDKKDCSKFTEVEKDTEYNYIGNYGKYVDIDGVLYEVIGLSPDDSCFYPH